MQIATALMIRLSLLKYKLKNCFISGYKFKVIVLEKPRFLILCILFLDCTVYVISTNVNEGICLKAL